MLIEIPLVLGHTGRRVVQPALSGELLHIVLAVRPVAAGVRLLAAPLVARIPTRFGGSQIAFAIAAPCTLLDISILRLDVLLVIRGVDGIPRPVVALRIEEQDIVEPPSLLAALPRIAVCSAALPYNLIPVSLGSKGGVKKQLQIVACSGIAVQVDAASSLQRPMQFDQPLRHHYEIRKHVVVTEQSPHRFDGVRYTWRCSTLHEFVERSLGILRPRPCVVEGFNLRLRLLAGLLANSTLYERFELNGGSRYTRSTLAVSIDSRRTSRLSP